MLRSFPARCADFYEPFALIHQNVYNSVPPVSYPGEIDGKQWDINALLHAIRPVVDFQTHTGCQIYADELSVIRWAPEESSLNYLRDVLSIFEIHGWIWAYHAFREWPGWSLEHEGPKSDTQGPLSFTKRLAILQSYWTRNTIQEPDRY